MKTIIIPIFGNRISPRLDYCENIQLIRIEDNTIASRDIIKIITENRLERINRMIKLKPDIIICDGLTEMFKAELIKSNIEVIPWVQGEVDKILNEFLAGTLIIKERKPLENKGE